MRTSVTQNVQRCAKQRLQRSVTRTMSTAVEAPVQEKQLLDKVDSHFARHMAAKRQAQFDELADVYKKRTSNTLAGLANPISETKRPAVYPFQPHSVNPFTGEYAVRPGERRPGVINLDTPLSEQILEYKRRIVNNYNAVLRPEAVVGDAAVYQSRLESNRERLSVLFDDDVRPFLNRQTRVSPIYKDTSLEQRTPRTPLPADTAGLISPTAGVLHSYRMHWIRMYLQDKKQRAVWSNMIPFDNVYNYDSTIKPISKANNAGVQEFMHYCKGVAAAHNSNFVPQDTMAFLGGIKKMLPLIAKVDRVKVVKVRRRKK